ncbi:tyrosine-protein kinase Fer [Planoprotostelium fungivorum]|uniref:Tyrosine-protein kinase Fer n=1 Tax=Planoprotostelium fungivorum TaxID=1890364 RepID=A0A2P6MWK9_9EUKA|nr:tyrosine-protein kinase Fer [Planoprotostelium fungivorum]
MLSLILFLCCCPLLSWGQQFLVASSANISQVIDSANQSSVTLSLSGLGTFDVFYLNATQRLVSSWVLQVDPSTYTVSLSGVYISGTKVTFIGSKAGSFQISNIAAYNADVKVNGVSFQNCGAIRPCITATSGTFVTNSCQFANFLRVGSFNGAMYTDVNSVLQQYGLPASVTPAPTNGFYQKRTLCTPNGGNSAGYNSPINDGGVVDHTYDYISSNGILYSNADTNLNGTSFQLTLDSGLSIISTTNSDLIINDVIVQQSQTTNAISMTGGTLTLVGFTLSNHQDTNHVLSLIDLTSIDARRLTFSDTSTQPTFSVVYVNGASSHSITKVDAMNISGNLFRYESIKNSAKRNSLFGLTASNISGNVVQMQKAGNVNITNTVVDSCGDVIIDQSSFNWGGRLGIYNSSFTGSGIEFPAISISSADVTIVGTLFDGFGTSSSGKGGAINVNSADNVHISLCKFTNNLSGGMGGAIYIVSTTTVDFSQNILKNNSATQGGAIFLSAITQVTMEDNYIKGCSASGSGGAVYIRNVNSTSMNNMYGWKNSASNSGGFLSINNNNNDTIVELYNMNVSYCRADNVGGMINVVGSDMQLSISGTLRGGVAKVQGGLVDISGSYKSVSLIDLSTLDGNTFMQGGCISVDGTIQNLYTSSIKVQNCSSKLYGGGLFIGGSVASWMSDGQSLLSNCSAFYGGAIHMDEDSTIDSIALNGYTLLNNRGGIYGGAMTVFNRVNRFSLHDSNCIDNEAVLQGGCLYLTGSVNEFTIDGSSFIGNLAGTTGAGIHVQDTFTSTTFTISNTSFSYNAVSAQYGAAIAMLAATDLFIQKSNFEENMGPGSSVYVYNGGSRFTVASSAFTSNHASALQGGAIYADGFDGNPLEISFLQNTFTSNVALEDGGAVYIGQNVKGFDASNGVIVLADNVWNLNRVLGPFSGGALSIASGGNVTFYNEIYNGNSIDTYGKNNGGGAIAFAASSFSHLFVNNVTFNSNSAQSGGAFDFVSGNCSVMTLSDVTLSGNSAEQEGGGARLTAQLERVIFERLRMYNNTARTGAGLYLENVKGVQVLAGMFDENSAQMGGGIYIAPSSSIDIVSTSFLNNEATSGGAIYTLGEVNASNCTYQRNKASIGGAVYLSKLAEDGNSGKRAATNPSVISGSRFADNAGTSGGAVAIYNAQDPSQVVLDGNQFSNNDAQNGKDVQVNGNATIESNQFSGGVYANSSGTLVSKGNDWNDAKLSFRDGASVKVLSDAEVSPQVSCSNGVGHINSNGQAVCTAAPAKCTGFCTPLYIIIVPVVGGVALLALIIVIFVVLRRRKTRRARRQAMEQELQLTMDKLILQEVEIGQVIGRGNFGEVCRGTWQGTTVALKGLRVLEMSEMAKFKEEIRLLHGLNHPNIVNLYGIFSKEEQLYMVLEYAEMGALDSYLRTVRKAEELTEIDLVTMVFDIVKGMVYLQTKNVIHRDIAARNMLLDTNRRVKISDFGLSRESDAYQLKSKQIPYKWTAPEVIRNGTSTMQSDVWSFGVCAWEIFSFVPYKMMDNRQAVEYVEEGKRMEKPTRCPDEMWQIILTCWSHKPESRPNFVTIRKQILELYGESLKEVKSTSSHVVQPQQQTYHTMRGDKGSNEEEMVNMSQNYATHAPADYSFSPEIGGAYH